jgi:protein-S-isoprenylcysteine O-methyltransferase Ste14
MTPSSVLLALRSLLWTILMPGMVAGYIPWQYFGLNRVSFAPGNPRQLLGLGSVVLGVALLAECIWEFARRGRGTLSPVDPPRHLVVDGLYRYVRNPMYVAVTLIVLGEALIAASGALVLYWLVFFTAANVFVIGYEEPWLRRRFGAAYENYSRHVGRWIPRLTSYRTEDQDPVASGGA